MNLDVSSHLHRHTVVKDQRPLPLIPRAARHGFERTGRTQRLQPTAFGAGTRGAFCLCFILVCVACLARVGGVWAALYWCAIFHFSPRR